MKATRRIYIALTICTIAVELCAQSSSTALPNAPEAHAFLLASAQSAPSLISAAHADRGDSNSTHTSTGRADSSGK